MGSPFKTITTDARISKGGQNPDNTSELRPKPPQGSKEKVVMTKDIVHIEFDRESLKERLTSLMDEIIAATMKKHMEIFNQHMEKLINKYNNLK